MDNRTVGVLGGGQLGRMLTEAAHRMNIKIAVLDAGTSPAKQINASESHINGSFADPDAIRELAKQCDILTIEIEHVDTEVLKEIELEGVEVIQGGEAVRKKVKTEPNWQTIRVIQDKYLQKSHLHSLEVPTAHSIALPSNSVEALAEAGKKLGYPFMLKSRTQAYDGRGNFPVKDATNIPAALEALGKRPLYAEKWVKFKGEVAVMVVKIGDRPLPCNDETVWKSDTLAYPVVETVHENSICKTVFASSHPTPLLSEDIAKKAEAMARKAVAGFWGTGIFGVEMFVTDEDDILINEIAPRPHNSGHYTIEGCYISQYDAHLRAILRMPFPRPEPQDIAWSPSTKLKPKTAAIMYNILGGPRPDSHISLCRVALVTPGASLHLYGKGDARPGRKMGHITVIAETLAQAREAIEPLRLCDIQSTNAVAAMPNIGLSIPARPISQSQALVAVTMGSDSDLPVLKPGIALLRDLGIPCRVTITSAHRTPGRMIAFAKEAASKGIKVIIAAAGGAAHLPGMVAANTPLPVIGVPVKGSTLDGMDSLLSIVQMPRGVPVATVAINNSLNAGLLAARILGTYNEEIRLRVEKYAGDMEAGVNEKIDRLEAEGWEQYVAPT